MTNPRRPGEIKDRASPVLRHPDALDLIQISESNSPSKTYDLVLAKTDDPKIARACRWLSVLKRDHSGKTYDDFVKQKRPSES